MQVLFRSLSLGGLGFIFLFLILPIIVAGSVSFTSDEFMSFPPVGFSFRWYEEMLSNPDWRRAIVNTVAIGAMCAALATAFGTLTAYGISRLRHPALRTACLVLFVAPLAVPHMSLAMALYPLFAALGLIGTRFGVALAQSVLALPFVVLIVSSIIRRRDRELERAARTLGATPLQSFRYVVLPLLMPGIAAGAIIAFMTSFDDVTVPIFLSGIHAGTVPKAMLDSLYLNSDPSVMAASTAISFLGLVMFVASSSLIRRRT